MLLQRRGLLLREVLRCDLLQYLGCQRHAQRVSASLGSVRCLATDDSDDSKKPARVPRAGSYRPFLQILKEEFDGITTMKPAGTDVPREADIVIVGGGIVGSTVAYFIKNRNPSASSITVIERDPIYTRSSSMLAWEGIRHQFSVPESVKMSMVTTDFLRDIKHHLRVVHESPPDVQFNHHGYLILAREQEAEQMAENVTMQKSLGANVSLLSKTQLAEQYPWMNLDGIECGSLGGEGEGWLDPWLYLRALKQKNISMGVKYVHGELIGFIKETLHGQGPKFKLDAVVTRLPDGREFETKFGFFVNCAGPWAADIAELAGIGTGDGELSFPLPVEPRKRYVFINHCPDGPTLDCPVVIDPSGLFLRREGYGGHYICGHVPTSEEDEPPVENFDVDYAYYQHKVLPNLSNRIPCFKTSKLKSGWAGYIDYNIYDQNPILGPHPIFKNFLFASGLGGHGLQHAAGIAQSLLELLFESEYITVDIEKFHFTRLLTDAKVQEQLIL